MTGRRARQRFEVNLTGAFLTGEPLQARVSEYSRFQRDIGDELKRDPSGGWDYEGVRWRDIGSYDTGGGYTSLVPLVLIRREGAALMAALEDAQRRRPNADRMWFSQLMAGWTWGLRAIRIDLYDFGVGVINGVYDVAAPTGLGVAATRRTIERLSWLRADATSGVESPVAASYRAIARETVVVFTRAVRKCANDARQEPWLAPLIDALPSGSDGNAHEPVDADPDAEWGRLMWLHPVYVLAGSPRASVRRLARISRPFEATYSKQVVFPHGVFIPGIDSSVVVVRGGIAGQQEVPMKLITLMWAYYGLFMEMDRGLLATIDNDKWSLPESLRALERDADRIFALHMRVQEAQARLDSALTDLGGGELSLWQVIADVVKFDDLMAAVEGKVNALQRIAERRVQQAAANRARRTSHILSALTALTIVTVTIAVLTNFIGSRADALGHRWLRIGVVVAAFVLAVVLYREAQRELTRRWQGIGGRKRARRRTAELDAGVPSALSLPPSPGESSKGIAAAPYGRRALHSRRESVGPASARP